MTPEEFAREVLSWIDYAVVASGLLSIGVCLYCYGYERGRKSLAWRLK